MLLVSLCKGIFACDHLFGQARLLTNKFMLHGFSRSRVESVKFYCSYNLICRCRLLLGRSSAVSSHLLGRSLHVGLPDRDVGLAAGVVGRRGMFAPGPASGVSRHPCFPFS